MVDAQIFRYPLQEPNAGALQRKFREGSCSPRARAAGTYFKNAQEGHIVFDTLAIAETLAGSEALPSAAHMAEAASFQSCLRYAARLSRAKAEKPQPQPSQKKWQWPMKAAHKQRGARGPNYTANARCQPSAHQLTSDTATQPRRRA